MNHENGRYLFDNGSVGKVILDEAEIKREILADKDYLAAVGEYWDPFLYIDHAVMCRSPFCVGKGLSTEEADLVIKILEKGPRLYKRDVLDKLAGILKMAADMEDEEIKIRRYACR